MIDIKKIIFKPDTQKKLAEYAIIIGLLLLLTTIFILMKTPVDIFIILIQLILVFLAFKHSRYLYKSLLEKYYSIAIAAVFIIIIICNIISITCSDNNPLRIFMLILDMIIMILYLFLFFYANETLCGQENNKKYNMFCEFFPNLSTTTTTTRTNPRMSV